LSASWQRKPPDRCGPAPSSRRDRERHDNYTDINLERIRGEETGWIERDDHPEEACIDDIEEGPGYDAGLDADRLVTIEYKGRIRRPDAGDILKCGICAAPIDDFRIRDLEGRLMCGIEGCKSDQAIWMAERESEQDAIHNREHRDGRADADGERQNCDDEWRRRFPKRARNVAQVEQERAHEPHKTTLFDAAAHRIRSRL
jgi:hypothetical protein